MNKLTLPNLLNKSDVRMSYNINNREYMVRFKWCSTFCIADIYYIENNTNKYIIKGSALTLANDLIARVKDDDVIQGYLMLVNKYGESTEPSQENLHTDYYLLYMEE